MSPLRSRFLLLFVLGAIRLAAAPGDNLEFDGILVEGGKTQVALLDLSTGVSKWVPVGGKFEGYVVGYDSGHDAVSLTRPNSTPFSIRLKDALILVTEPAGPWIQPSNAQRALVVANLQMLRAAAAQYLADNGMPASSLDDLVGTGRLLPELNPVAGESYTGVALDAGAVPPAVALPDGTRIAADGTSTASDGSRILPDGGRVTTAGTHLAPDGTVVSSNPAGTGPYIPYTASPLTASALEAVGWKYRPAGQ